MYSLLCGYNLLTQDASDVNKSLRIPMKWAREDCHSILPLTTNLLSDIFEQSWNKALMTFLLLLPFLRVSLSSSPSTGWGFWVVAANLRRQFHSNPLLRVIINVRLLREGLNYLAQALVAPDDEANALLSTSCKAEDYWILGGAVAAPHFFVEEDILIKQATALKGLIGIGLNRSTVGTIVIQMENEFLPHSKWEEIEKAFARKEKKRKHVGNKVIPMGAICYVTTDASAHTLQTLYP